MNEKTFENVPIRAEPGSKKESQQIQENEIRKIKDKIETLKSFLEFNKKNPNPTNMEKIIKEKIEKIKEL